MGKGYILYNPHAGMGKCASDAALLEAVWDDDLEYVDMAALADYKGFFAKLDAEDYLILAGGDGTLNRFANDTANLNIDRPIYYFPTGTGNDFAREFRKTALCNPFPITQYLKDLPTVEVNGRVYRFLNGVGFGIDGYCCQVGDELRKDPGKKVNYTAIAIKGLLLHFDARKAKVTVDGKVYHYDRVWIAPTMHGKCYGGGMFPTPNQDRSSGQLSVMLFHGAGRLRTLCVFPSIFKGEHVKYKSMVTIHTGREITVEFDRPTPLQIDGETILGVTAYTARSSK